MNEVKLMKMAIEEAKLSELDVPVGALLISPDGRLLAKAHNQREKLCDPSAHAEILVLREVGRELRTWHLDGTTLVVTLEPCAMCAAAISDARVSRVIFGAWDQRLGAAGSKYDILRDEKHGNSLEVKAGVLAEECAGLLKAFFETKRD